MPKALAWERRQDETAKAFEAFRVYLDMGEDRALKQVAWDIGQKGPAQVYAWSVRHDWVDRCREWESHRAIAEMSARTKVARLKAAEWERRRWESLEESWSLGEQLKDRVREMLRFPLTRQVVSEVDGVEVTSEERDGWNYQALVQMARLAMELQVGAAARATAPEDEDFDPSTASVEECRAFLARFAPHRSLPSPQPEAITVDARVVESPEPESDP